MKVLWTDGSADPNPGPGGWAVIDGDTKKPLMIGREQKTTNIRMEGTAILYAIKYAAETHQPIEIRTDSQFWINVLTKWAPVWAIRNWHKSSGPIKNLDLVQPLYKLYSTNHIKLTWVHSHVGTELNEIADEWAKKARRGATL